ncbi:Ig-like domain-containing protein, partial [Geoglobus sp.]
MSKVWKIGIAVLATLLIAMATASAGTVTVDKTLVAPGDTIQIDGTGFTGVTGVNISIGGNWVAVNVSVTNGNFSTTVTVPSLPSGIYPIEVYDNSSGNQLLDNSTSITVDADAPTVTIIRPTEGANVLYFSMEINVADTYGLSQITWMLNDTANTNGTVTLNGETSFVYYVDITTLSKGTYQLTVTSTDLVGNSA